MANCFWGQRFDSFRFVRRGTSSQALHDGIQQQAHAFRNKRALKEQYRVLVFVCGIPRMHSGEISSKLGLLERTPEDIFVMSFHLGSVVTVI